MDAVSATGFTAKENGPQRRCVITREQRPQKRLLRLAAHPGGDLVPDLAARLPGRGLYVLPNPTQVRALLKRRRLSAPETAAFMVDLERLLVQRLLDGIGLARRAGSLRRGLEECEKVLAGRAPGNGGQEVLLLLATDTADHTRKKAERLAARYDVETPLPILDRERFGSMFGGGLVAVLAVVDSGMCRRVGNDAWRWLEFVTT